MDRIEIAVRIIARTVAMLISDGLKIDIDTLVDDAFDAADKVVERDKEPAGAYPSWANWIAQDADGEWFCYDYQPVTENGRWWPVGNSLHRSIGADDPNPNWRATLRRLR